jgi:hypothetical protein
MFMLTPGTEADFGCFIVAGLVFLVVLFVIEYRKL